jgi:hypothetical protein
MGQPLWISGSSERDAAVGDEDVESPATADVWSHCAAPPLHIARAKHGEAWQSMSADAKLKALQEASTQSSFGS